MQNDQNHVKQVCKSCYAQPFKICCLYINNGITCIFLSVTSTIEETEHPKVLIAASAYSFNSSSIASSFAHTLQHGLSIQTMVLGWPSRFLIIALLYLQFSGLDSALACGSSGHEVLTSMPIAVRSSSIKEHVVIHCLTMNSWWLQYMSCQMTPPNWENISAIVFAPIIKSSTPAIKCDINFISSNTSNSCRTYHIRVLFVYSFQFHPHFKII